ncbi:MAG TPA: hypothetical protein VNZ53_19920 [Steroidobacteraceae bacterium]|nr:hypothetical protein [Steroidobacteraceae bacterium]
MHCADIVYLGLLTQFGARERVVGFSAADEIEKLDRLKKAKSISAAEFARLRANLVQ